MGLASDYDRLAEQIHALSTLVNALSEHMRLLRVALSSGEVEAKEAADRARVGVVDGWCPKSRVTGAPLQAASVEWCCMAGAHEGPCSFEKPRML